MANFVGTASWSIPKQYRNRFDLQNSILETYATKFNAVEINTSFYKEHKSNTYAKWRESVPPDFRFSVKLFKNFTHDQRLDVNAPELEANIQGVLELREKLGCLLVQLPPSLDYDSDLALHFFATLREFYVGPLAFEPRHISWECDEAKDLLSTFLISRVLADPQTNFSRELDQDDFNGLLYMRMHGSPHIYKSSYEQLQLNSIAKRINESKTQESCITQAWCIFDNTAFGYATENALSLNQLLE